jgi:hypothetical protein
MNPATIANIKTKVQHLIATNAELQDDAELRLDMIEAETDALEILRLLRLDYNAKMAESAGLTAECEIIKALANRKEIQANNIKITIGAILDTMNEKKVKLANGQSVYFAYRGPSPVVADEGKLPDQFWRVKREVNKTAINDWLKAGNPPPEGVVMNNGSRTLTIK